MQIYQKNYVSSMKVLSFTKKLDITQIQPRDTFRANTAHLARRIVLLLCPIHIEYVWNIKIKRYVRSGSVHKLNSFLLLHCVPAQLGIRCAMFTLLSNEGLLPARL